MGKTKIVQRTTQTNNGIDECDISAILWKNPWKTPLDVYNDKVNPPSETMGL